MHQVDPHALRLLQRFGFKSTFMFSQSLPAFLSSLHCPNSIKTKKPPKRPSPHLGGPVHLIQVPSVTHHRMSNLGSDIIIYNETPSWFCNWVWLSIAQVLWVEESMSAIRLLSHSRVWRTETSEAGVKISFNIIDCMYSNFILSRLDHYSYCLITCIKKSSNFQCYKV